MEQLSTPSKMETASCSTLHSLCLSATAATRKKRSRFYYDNYQTPPRNILAKLHVVHHPFSSAFPRNHLAFFGKHEQLNGFRASCSSPGSSSQDPSPELALLLEVDGVLMDAYRLGNRQSFNIAFQKLGLDCANWTDPIYADLLRRSQGDEEKMLVLYFNRIGWPSSLPTSEKSSFVKSVLREKKKALDEFAASGSSPLRPGVEAFIDDVSNEGIPVVILTAYGKSEEKVARSIVDKLGHERLSKVKIVGNEEVEQSLYGQLVLGKVLLSGVDEELAKEASKAVFAEKQRIAEEVASMLKLSIELDTSSSESLQKIVAALRAGAEYAGTPVSNCILIAGSQLGVAAAERIAMPCIVMRSSLTARGEFPSAKATMDGFGAADLTISKLKNKRWS